MSLEPKNDPAQHFSLRGDAEFRFADSSRTPITQAVEIALGGPSHMRFLLRSGGKHNAFLLEDTDKAWLKLPGKPAATAYEAEELAEDALLRWIVLQFPWSMKKELAASKDWLEFKGNGKAATIWRLQLSDRALPEKIFRKTDRADSFELHLELSQWVAGADDILYPTTWIWHRQWGEMEESFQEMSGGVLYFNSAFRPKSAEVRSYNTLRSEATPTFQRAATHFGLVNRSMVWLDDALYAELEPKPAAKKWLLYQQADLATEVWVLDRGADGLPEGIHASGQIDGQLCLLWRSFRPLDPATAAQRLRQTAEQNKYRIVGPVWVLEVPTDSETALREYLLPVAQ
jgi:hypothetical protein